MSRPARPDAGALLAALVADQAAEIARLRASRARLAHTIAILAPAALARLGIVLIEKPTRRRPVAP
jgi:hypothetical protein